MEMKDIVDFSQDAKEVLEFLSVAKQFADSEQGQHMLKEVMDIAAKTIKPMLEAVNTFVTDENIKAYHQYINSGIASEHAITLLASRNMHQSSSFPMKFKK